MADSTPLEDERLAELLASYTEARAAGRPADDLPEDLDPESVRKFREARECLDLLHEVWPRDSSQTRTSPYSSSLSPDGVDLLPDHIGRFAILRELGRGGGGVVYLAVDPELARQVAVKVPRPEALVEPELRQRFVREGQAAAGLEHPGLIPVFEAGADGPLCYLVSAYCPGPNLRDWLQTRRKRGEPVPVREAAWIVAELAEALAFIHGRGVLHRDIKPGNVLLQPDPAHPDTPGHPRLTDFGHAKLAEDQRLTQSNARLGTPLYMAPEQIDGHLAAVGPGTDVHALGLILYELLTGDVPFRGQTQAETFQRILKEEPVPPRKLRAKVHVDLETICLGCLEKEPGQRYPRASELAGDLRRFLANEPIQRRPICALERIGRWCRKNPLVSLLTACIVFALVGLSVVGFWLRTTQQEAKKAVEQAREQAELAQYDAVLSRTRLRVARKSLGWRRASLDDLKTIVSLRPKLRDPAELRTEVTECLTGIDVREKAVLVRDFEVGALGFSPDGQYLALAQHKQRDEGKEGEVRLIHLATGTARKLTFKIHPCLGDPTDIDGARSLCFSPDGRFLVVGSRSGWVHSWDLSQPKRSEPIYLRQHAAKHQVYRVAFSPDGKSLFSFGKLGNIQRCVFAYHAFELARFQAAPYRSSPAWSPDGTRIACSTGDGVQFLNAGTLKPCNPHFSVADANDCCFSPCGRILAVGGRGEITLLGTDIHGEKIHSLEPVDFLERDVCWERVQFNKDGSLLIASSGLKRVVGLWDVASGRLLATLLPEGGGPLLTAFHPAEHSLVIGCGGQVVLYEITGLQEQQTLAHHGQTVRTFTFSPRGNKLLCLADGTRNAFVLNGRVTFWDIVTGQQTGSVPIWLPEGGDTTVSPLAQHPHKEVFAYASGIAQIEVRNLVNGQPARPLLAREPRVLCFSPAGQRLWGITASENVQSWNWVTGKEISRWPAQSNLPAFQCLDAGSTWVLVGDQEDTPWLLRASDGQLHRAWPRLDGPVSSVALHPGEALAACGAQSGRVRVVRVPDGKTLAELNDHIDQVTSLAFSPDGQLLATGSRDRSVNLYLWQKGTCRRLLTLRSFHGGINHLRFHPDGRRLGILVYRETAVRILRLDRLRDSLARLHLDDSDWPAFVSPDSPHADQQQDRDLKQAYDDVRLAVARGIRLSRHGDRQLGRLWLARALELLGDRDQPLQQHIRLYLAQPNRRPDAWFGPNRGEMLALAFHPDRQHFLTGHDRGHGAQLWDQHTLQPVGPPLPHQANVSYVAFTADGQTMLTASQDGAVRFWEMGTSKPLKPSIQTAGFLGAIALQPATSNLLLTVCDPKVVRCWDVPTRKPLSPDLPQEAPVNSVTFSQDGKWFLVTCVNGIVQLYKAATREPVFTPPFRLPTGVTCGALHPNGSLFATSSPNGTVQLWDRKTLKQVGLPLEHAVGINKVVFGPNGDRLATRSHRDGTVRLWHVPTGEPLGEPLLHPSEATLMTFSPDGTYIGTSCRDHIIRWWEFFSPPAGRAEEIKCQAEVDSGRELIPDGQTRLLDQKALQLRRRQLGEGKNQGKH
jgi:WD40 repeat protein/serine/threonine protein kinase